MFYGKRRVLLHTAVHHIIKIGSRHQRKYGCCQKDCGRALFILAITNAYIPTNTDARSIPNK